MDPIPMSPTTIMVCNITNHVLILTSNFCIGSTGMSQRIIEL
jgi:hypothetical protein